MKNPRVIAVLFMAVIVASCDKILLSEQTQFAPGFSERSFNKVRKGMPVSLVTNLLSSPLALATQQWSDVWLYKPKSPPQPPVRSGEYTYDLFGDFTRFSFDELGRIRDVSGQYLKGDFLGMDKGEILQRFGQPAVREKKEFQIIYRYTLPGKSGTYKRRDVCFDTNGVVSYIAAELYHD